MLFVIGSAGWAIMSAATKVIVSCVENATGTVTKDRDAESIIESIRADKRDKLREPIERIREVYRAELEKTGDREAAKRAVTGDKKKTARGDAEWNL